MNKLRMAGLVALMVAGLLGAGCARGGGPAANAVTPETLRAHTEFLADDLLEGRAPASRGSELAATYIAAQFRRLGLEPAGEDGTYFQSVPVVGKTVTNAPRLRVFGRGRRLSFQYKNDFVGETDLEQASLAVRGELVFAGYGITAPEFDWDDFKDVNVEGKILLLLVNDPPAPDEEPELFGGKALTYYGRWTYKYEEAARQGAAGAILIHTTESAGYPWKVVQSSWTGEQFSLERGPNSPPPLPLKSWVSRETATKILGLVGETLEELQQVATRRDFQPIPLGITVSTQLRQKVRRIASPNVAGLLRGGARAEQYVAYMAHYDHLGMSQAANGDTIYNGAADNAVGVAALLTIAEAFARAPQPPQRSILFLAVTAEESGLLGSAYYAQNPLLPLAQTAAVVNIDGANTIGPTRDITVVGYGKSDLDGVVEAAARALGMTVQPDQFPEQGFFYRSDQFSLAKVGVPAVYLDNGLDVIGQPEGYGKQKFDEYVVNDYHQPSDEIKADWDWSGTVQHTRLLLDIGWRVAQQRELPRWNESAEFKAARDASLK
jgi:Zn-dependent M28 family amino/carboxypeptidase